MSVLRSRFAKLDVHMQEVIKGASLAFILKVVGAALAFTFNVVIARLLGAEGAGLFFLALSVTVIGSVIGRIGLDNTLLRFIATHATKGEWGRVKGVYVIGMRIAVVASGSLSIIGFWLAPWMSITIFNKPDLVEPLRWMSLTILPFALLNLHAESLKGLKKIRNAVLVQNIGVPLIGLVLIWPLAQNGSVLGVSWTYLAATALIALMSTLAWRQSISTRIVPTDQFPFKELLNSCIPLFANSLLKRAILPWGPLFLLGSWATSAEVGIFGAASRVTILISFALGTIATVLAPKFAEIYAQGDMKILLRTAKRSTLMISLLCSPIFIILIFGADWVMAIFGPEFVEGQLILVILAVGQFVNVLTGPVGILLTMTGYERYTFWALALSTITLMVLCTILIPLYGMIGCAFAVMISEILKNILLTKFCFDRFGITLIPIHKG